MFRSQHDSTWPFLILLLGLFVLSALAPRSWQSAIHRQTSNEVTHSLAPQLFATEALPVAPESLAPSELEEPAMPEVAGPLFDEAANATPQLANPLQPYAFSAESLETPRIDLLHTPTLAPPRSEGPSAPAVRPMRDVALPDDEGRAPAATGSKSIEPTAATGSVTQPEGLSTDWMTIDPDREAGRRAAGQAAAPLAPLPLQNLALTAPTPRIAHHDTGAGRIDLAPVAIPASSAAPAPSAAGPAASALPWQEPASLIAMLDELSSGPTQAWAAETKSLVVALAAAMPQASPEVTPLLRRLAGKLGELPAIEARLHDRDTVRRTRRAGYALLRRLSVWNEMASATPPHAVAAAKLAARAAESQQLLLAVNDVAALVGNSPEGRAWCDYLMLDALRDAAAQQRLAEEDAAATQLAETIARRLSRPNMSEGQRRLVANPAVAALQAHLQRLAAPSVDLDAVLAHLEEYEASRLPSDARALADDAQALNLAWNDEGQQIGRQIQTHYRNANLRIVVSSALMNRLIPQPPAEWMPVHDTVVGQPVRGQSLLATELSVRLLPDPRRIRAALEVRGQVVSSTKADAGPARFYSDGNATYTAVRPLEVDMKGIRLSPVDVTVQNQTQLKKIETDLDGVPLISTMVRNIARQQHDAKLPEANREIRAKVATRAEDRVEAESTARLTEFAHRFHDRVLLPLNTLQLEPTIIDAQTTDERIAMRLRLAGEDQLGAHTPRPQAPSDSLASLQVHESALNNALDRLELDGRTFALPALLEHLAHRLGRQDVWESNPENDDVVITFAPRDALLVTCDDDQIAVTLSIARLSKAPRAWSNFRVRAFYRPVVQGLSAELQRDGVIHLIDAPSSLGTQIALRGIFTKTFSRKTAIPLTPPALAANEKLNDLEISQFTIEDGWVGMAIGPKRAATAMLPSILRR